MADPETTPAAPANAGPAAANPAAATPAAPAATPADPIAAFQAALAAHDTSAAIAAWNNMSSKQHKKWKPTAKVLEIMDGIGPTAVRMMQDAGANFRQSDELGKKVLAHPDPVSWMTPMAAFGLSHDFADANPRRGALTDAEAKAVGKMTEHAAGSADAKKYFGKAYPSLHDSTYGHGWLWTRAWTTADVRRMVRAVVSQLPHQHMQTITGGFYIGTHIIETGKTKKTELGYAFYDSGRIVMPAWSTADGGHTTHDMVLGGESHDNPLAPSGLLGMADHFDGSALHEVGHGVGEHSDGNSWAVSNGYTAWKKETRASATAKLWDDASATASVAGMKKSEKIDPADAKRILARFIEGNNISAPKGWKTADAVKFLKDKYGSQKLYQYARVRSKTDESYKFEGQNNVDSGRAYVYLSRWGDSWASYSEAALTEKVSWYSLSSPLEWFAEQYAAYYQFGPTNSIQKQVVKDKLKVIDGTKFTKNKLRDASKSKGGGGSGGGAAGADGMAGPEGPGAETSGTSAPTTVRRSAFNW